MLQAINITKNIDGRSILQDVSISIEKGKITAVIGPSGSGKTSLIRNLSLLDRPDSGKIMLDGKEQFSPAWPKVSVVFQQLFIWPHLTLRENILLPLKDASAEKLQQLEGLIETFGMQAFIDRYPNETSLGQRQRTALVRALMLDPEYLLLDEITSSLDAEQSAVILSHLTKIKELGIGIIMVAHNIDFALSIADEVAFLEQGKIAKRGKPYEFLMETKDTRIGQFVQDAFLGSPDIKVYTGEEEFQAYHMHLIKRLPENSSINIVGGVGSTWYEPMKKVYEEYTRLRLQKKITWNMLMYESGAEEKDLVRRSSKLNVFHTLSPDVKNMSNINVNSDGTVILQIFKPVPSVIEIRNQVVAQSYMNYFKDLLKGATLFKG